MDEIIDELIKTLESFPPPETRIAVMPHFCLDNYVHFGEDLESFSDRIRDVASGGGGNLALPQLQRLGGKAANCASALDALGLHSSLFAQTSELGYLMLQDMVKGGNIDISHVRRDGTLAVTTAIELENANIMISDPGSLAAFGPGELTERDEGLLREADLVCISDWGLNEKGTELAEHIFGMVRDSGRGRTFFDPGDPRPKKNAEAGEIKHLKKVLLEPGLVDILSVNEDEVERYGGTDYLSSIARVDLHSASFSASYLRDGEIHRVPSFHVRPKRLTGAGDAWNAGDILGEILGLPAEMRLLLANAAAASYISDPGGRHPTGRDLVEFLKSHRG